MQYFPKDRKYVSLRHLEAISDYRIAFAFWIEAISLTLLS